MQGPLIEPVTARRATRFEKFGPRRPTHRAWTHAVPFSSSAHSTHPAFRGVPAVGSSLKPSDTTARSLKAPILCGASGSPRKKARATPGDGARAGRRLLPVRYGHAETVGAPRGAS